MKKLAITQAPSLLPLAWKNVQFSLIKPEIHYTVGTCQSEEFYVFKCQIKMLCQNFLRPT